MRWGIGLGVAASIAALAMCVGCGGFDSGNDATPGADAGDDGGLIHGHPLGSLAVSVDGKQVLTRGRTNVVTVKVARHDGYDGPVVVRAAGLPPQIAAAEVTLDASSSTAELKLAVAKDLPQGDLKGVAIEAASPTGDPKASAPLVAFVRGAPGELDTSFGTKGALKIGLVSEPNEPAMLATDGSLYVASATKLFHVTPDGAPDTSFGTLGAVTLGAERHPRRTFVLTSSVLLVRDDKKSTTVEKLDLAGAPDATFGTGGAYTPDTDGDSYGAAFRPDGRGLTMRDDTIHWVSAAGTANTSVSGNGTTTAPDNSLRAAVYLADSVVAVSGPTILKLKSSDGSADATFGDAGIKTLDENTFWNDIVLDAEGRFLVTGQRALGPLNLMRVLSNGTADPGFAGEVGDFDAKAEALLVCATSSGCVNWKSGYAGRLAVQPDGKILQAAQIDEGGAFRCTIVRFLPDGKRDTDFGDNGRTTLPIDGCTARGVFVQPDGRIVVGGSVLVRVWN